MALMQTGIEAKQLIFIVESLAQLNIKLKPCTFKFLAARIIDHYVSTSYYLPIIRMSNTDQWKKKWKLEEINLCDTIHSFIYF